MRSHEGSSSCAHEQKLSQFFDAFDSLIVLTICSDAYISRSGDFCAHNDNNNDDDDRQTDKPIASPLAHVHGVKTGNRTHGLLLQVLQVL